MYPYQRRFSITLFNTIGNNLWQLLSFSSIPILAMTIFKFKIVIVNYLFNWYYCIFSFLLLLDINILLLSLIPGVCSAWSCDNYHRHNNVSPNWFNWLLTDWLVNNAPEDVARRVISCYLEEPRNAERGRCYISLGHRTLRTHTPTMVAARLVSALLPLRTTFTCFSII